MSEEGEVRRLEALWREDFGDRYIERNRAAAEGREPFWRGLYEGHPFASALEVGCNVGGNLRWLAAARRADRRLRRGHQRAALRELRATLPDVNAVLSPARSLPFRDGLFDLTFTTAVLIHQPPDALPIVMNEVVRCSRRYVLCGEYFSEQLEEVHYRGDAARCSSATGARSIRTCSRS